MASCGNNAIILNSPVQEIHKLMYQGQQVVNIF